MAYPVRTKKKLAKHTQSGKSATSVVDGLEGITFAEARERLGKTKRKVATGKSPAKEKSHATARSKGAETFDAWADMVDEWTLDKPRQINE